MKRREFWLFNGYEITAEVIKPTEYLDSYIHVIEYDASREKAIDLIRKNLVYSQARIHSDICGSKCCSECLEAEEALAAFEKIEGVSK